MVSKINSNVLTALDVVRYKRKYRNIMKLSHFIPNIKDKMLLQLRDDIDFNWGFVIITESNTDLCDLYKKINISIEQL